MLLSWQRRRENAPGPSPALIIVDVVPRRVLDGRRLFVCKRSVGFFFG